MIAIKVSVAICQLPIANFVYLEKMSIVTLQALFMIARVK